MATVISRLGDERGISTLWVAAFMAFVLAPLLALGIEIGRYAEARTMIQAAADLGALAAAKEADLPHFQQTGEWRLLPKAHSVAKQYAAQNLTFAGKQKISARVTGVNVAGNQVRVGMSADVSELFPAFVGHVTINVIGTAEMRIR